MKVISIKTKVYVKENISQEESISIVANFVDKCLCNDENWNKMHNETTFKPWSFSSLSPISKDGTYKRDSILTFTLRTIDLNLAQYLMEQLRNVETNQLKGLVSEVWMVPQKKITKIYSITPVIVRGAESGYWREKMSLEEYQNLIKTNLIKKYNFFAGTKIDENFNLWTKFTITNKKVIGVPYKGITLLCDKVEMEVAENKTAQDLAYLALATSIGNIGSRGFGYINFHIEGGVNK